MSYDDDAAAHANEIPQSPSPPQSSHGDTNPETFSSFSIPKQSRSDAIASKATPLFEELTEQSDGLLSVDRLGEFLRLLDFHNDVKLVESLVDPTKKELTLDDALTMLKMIAPSSPTGTTRSSWSSLAKAPLKKVLTKNRDYMETGTLAVDETVMAYIAKLDDHRKKCETEGRYTEAKAASLRLADLKTAQVERLRLELINNQKAELEDVHSVYADESVKFTHMWDKRVKEFEVNFNRGVDEMTALHEKQREELVHQMEVKRPTKPKLSRDYLNQKKIEESLVKVKLYTEASQVKDATEEMYQSELEQAHASFEGEQRLKLVKYQSKQAQEFDAMLQRGKRGRDELQLRRVSETDRRNNRFRNIVMELESLHKLEVVHLENFLDGQVKAGKAVPLKDGFRRKREALLSTDF